MTHTEIKFAYRHKPTSKWVYIDSTLNETSVEEDKFPYDYEIELVDSFMEATMSPRKNALTSDLKYSAFENDEKYAANNFLEFELVEIEVEYRLKA